jgi:hypothetical protein
MFLRIERFGSWFFDLEFSNFRWIQGGLTWRHLSDSFLTGRVTQDLKGNTPDMGLNIEVEDEETG